MFIIITSFVIKQKTKMFLIFNLQPDNFAVFILVRKIKTRG